jgi:RNA polymerase sigma-70 factor, ECF subfamily
MLNAKALQPALKLETDTWQARNREMPVNLQTACSPVPISALRKPMSKLSSDSQFDAAWSEWNPANFDRIVDTYQTKLYRFIYSMVGEAELARDLTQDTLLLAYRNLNRRAAETEDSDFSQNPGQQNMSAWLYTIARNTALSELRRRKIVRFLPFVHKSSGSDEEVDSTSEVVQLEAGGNLEARTALHDELQQAMDKVGRDKLTALLLHMDGFSYKEICDITGDSLSSIKSQIFRAKESLRRALASSTTPLTPDFGEGRR